VGNKVFTACIWILALSSSASVKAQDRSTEFDGQWKMDIECPTFHHVATPFEGWTLSYPITIKDGMAEGRLEPEKGLGGMHHVHGPVAANGVTKLTYDGTKGDVSLGLYREKFLAKGTKYQMHIEAKFSGNVGEGIRRTSMGNCKIRFSRL
jgi:hypothetical protein